QILGHKHHKKFHRCQGMRFHCVKTQILGHLYIIMGMNIFKAFEKQLETLFEGVFLRAFKSGVHPVELGKKLVREIEGNKTISTTKVYVPNRFWVGLSRKDYSRFESYQAALATELENLLLTYIREKGYAVFDRPRIRMVEEEQLHEGEFWIESKMEGETPQAKKAAAEKGTAGTGVQSTGHAYLELMDSGEIPPVFELENKTIQIGRSGQDNDIVLPDPNVSRVHVRIYPKGDSFFIEDLNSTNGTVVNEEGIQIYKLKDNDVIRLGGTRLLFREG
ncbi:MAG: DUF3662 and FHA domain-containing protein, partial [Actinobacteria bacterium]|nr:DUF3662 and FHA domain-containing protein [Actinomycetota bacterium]